MNDAELASTAEAACYFTLLTLPRVGFSKAEKILTTYGDARTAVEHAIRTAPELGIESTEIAWRSRQIRGEIESAIERGIRLIDLNSTDFPENLRNSIFRKRYLFQIGEQRTVDSHSIAVIGTSTPTSLGTENVNRFVEQLRGQDVDVVSGLARGIDGAAHSAALECGVRTHAVVGTGLNTIYPPEHRGLFQKILSQGSVFSQFLPTFGGAKWSFPERNKTMAGISLSTVLFESKPGSGSLLQARNCLNDGRPLFIHASNLDNSGNRVWLDDLVNGGGVLFENWSDIREGIRVPRSGNFRQDPLW